MNIVEKIYKEASRLPEDLAKEILDFIEHIEKKHGLKDRDLHNLKESQIPVMEHIWNNEEDWVWDEY